MSHYTKEWCKIWRKTYFFCFKNDKNLVNFDPNTKKSTLHFDRSLLCKAYNVWPKKYRGVIFRDTEESCKIWRKTDLWFGYRHEEFRKLSSKLLRVPKLVFSWDPFVLSRKCMSYNLERSITLMTLKNDEKPVEELTCRFKIDIKNLMNFDSRTWKSQKIYTLMGCFWPKYVMFELKKVQRSYISWH